MDVRTDGRLTGVSVLVAGAGLAGLAAARDLVTMGAQVTVIEARDRVGGRVQTVRQAFADNQHAEAGGDFIDDSHHQIRTLAADLGLKLVRVLRSGFGYARPDRHGRVRIVGRHISRGWARLGTMLADQRATYQLAERRWDTPIAADIGRRSVQQWLQDIGADDDLRATATGLRGFFLADPEELSLLALVDQFSGDGSGLPGAMYRIQGGNDRLALALAAELGDRIQLNTELVAVSHRGRGVRASLKHRKDTAQLQVDYVLFALPATLLRRIPITPALPAQQHEAIARLRYGRATKTLLQFAGRPWRAAAKPRAFGSPLQCGAVWEGNEEQRGRSGILALLAGGGASDATRDVLARDGVNGLVRSLDWIGVQEADLRAWQQTVWESEPWSRGGYAYFDPGFDVTLRGWLARPCGPLFFAGEHTSLAGQGYMNGAVESGRRAAAEVAATRKSTHSRMRQTPVSSANGPSQSSRSRARPSAL
jgi:monoamine oxidase